MGLETATYISQLVSTNPVGATDDYATADDHLRLIKSVLQAQFPNFTAAAVTSTVAELNKLDGFTGLVADLNILSGAAAGGLTAAELLYVAGVTSDIQTQLNGKAASSHTHTASEITDFDTEVSNNASVAANTAKVSNATHTGQVTGSTALSLAAAAITGQTDIGADLVGTDEILVSDAGALRRADISRIATYISNQLAIPVTKIKPALEVRNNTTTFTDDADLAGFSLDASSTYIYELHLNGWVRASSDLKILFQYSNAPSASRGIWMYNNGGPTAMASGPTTSQRSILLDADQTSFPYREHGYIVTSAATTLDFQWAQITSQVHDTQLFQGCYLKLTKIA